MDLQKAKAALEYLVDQIGAKDFSQDRIFDALRKETMDLVKEYSADPLNGALIRRAEEIVEQYGTLDASKLSGERYQRAAVNRAVVTSRIRRTHFAAYLAGRYAADKDVGSKYKAWMHNAAANGALSLQQALLSLSAQTTGGAGIVDLALIDAFADAACDDALRFLAFAEQYEPGAAITTYNMARCDILSGDRRRIRLGVEKLKSIREPNSRDAHPAELSWHKDNYHSYCSKDDKMRQLIDTIDGLPSTIVEGLLRRNCEAAMEIEQTRGEEWPPPSNARGRGVMIACAVGGAVLAAVCLSSEAREAIIHVVGGLTDLLAAAAADPTLSVHGDGGVAMIIRAGLYGDGGVA